jgi:hypothetical protein
MATYVNDLRLKEISTGDEAGTWGTSTNTNLELIAEAFSFGTEAITTNADTHTTTLADGATDPGRSMFLKYTGTLDSTCTVTIGPNTISKLWFIENATSGSQSIIISQGSGANVTIANGQTKAIYSDGAGSGAAMVDAFQDLSVPDLFVDDDLTIGDDLVLSSDSAVITFGADGDTTLTHTDGSGLTLNSTNKIMFNDASQFIQGSSATVLALGATDEIDLTATAIDVNGTMDVSGALTGTTATFTTADNLAALTVISTDADANVGPLINFQRDSGSPADDDVLGRMNFNGSNDASEDVVYGRIQTTIKDASDGTEDGELSISTIVAGTNRGRAKFGATETVFNEASQDLDFRVESDGNANMLFVDAGNNRVLIGTNTPVTAFTTAAFQVSGTSNAPSTMSIGRFSDNANAPVLNFIKSRNASIGGNTILGGGDNLGSILFNGNDGVDSATSAVKILGEVDGTPGSNDMPGRLVFSTTADGSNSTSEHLRITNAGNIGIGDSSPSTKLHVTTSDQDDGITIECTNGGASAGPSLKLDRSSSGPADNDAIGEIEFSGRNDASQAVQYARITSSILDASDGTEDGSIKITAMLAGTTRSRFFSNSTETVINEDSQDIDFRVETNTEANALFVQGSSNRVVLGFNAQTAVAAINPHLSVVGTDNGGSAIGLVRYSADTGGPRFVLTKSRNGSITTAGGTIVQDGDTTGMLMFSADDGSDMATRTARIQSAVDGTPGSNDMPGRLQFFTTADGASSETERMRIDDSGALLINTTTDHGGIVNIATADNTTQLALVSTDADASVGPRLDMIRDSSSPAANDVIGVVRFMGDDAGGTSISYVNLQAIIEDPTDGSEDGSFKIETRVGSTLRDRINMTSTETIMNSEGVDLDFRVESDTSTHCLFVNAGTNKVGIKTSAPDGQLHIHTASAGTVTAGTAADELVLENSTDVGMAFLCPNDQAASIHFGDTDDNNVGMLQYHHDTDHMEFTVNAVERMRIDSNGVLLINTTTAVADDMTAGALHVAKNATTTSPTMIVDDADSSVESGSICMAVMFSNDNSFSGAKYISFRDLGGEQGSVSGDGAGSVAYNTSSDMRLKTNIQDTASQWDTIKALQVRDYEWIANGNEETGFIAQEIYEQIPKVVHVGGEEATKEPWSVDYGRITPQLTKALQEAMARIETLETELAKLKGGS